MSNTNSWIPARPQRHIGLTRRLALRYTLAAIVMGVASSIAVAVANPQPAAAAACTVPSPDKGVVTQTLTNVSAGTYRVWSRISAPNATNNSYFLEVDGNQCYTIGDAAIAANQWTWVDYQNGASGSKVNITLSAGNHTLRLIGREDGVKLDRVLLTTNTSCTPTGTGDNCAVSVDNEAPTVPTGLSATAVSPTQVNLSWSAATDDTAVTGYQIYRNGSQIATTANRSYTDSSVSASTTYNYTVRAYDAAGNVSGHSTQVSVTTPAPSDTTPPHNVSLTSPTSGSVLTGTVTLRANASDNVGVARVEFYRGSTYLGQAAAAPYQYSWNTATTSNGTYTLTARAFDAAGNSTNSAGVSVTVNHTVPDTTAPSVPSNVRTISVTSSAVSIAWNASTDNVGVAKYLVQRGGVTIAETTTTSYTDTTVLPQTSYTYRIRAVDAAGNTSGTSSALNVTTPDAPDTTPPTAPSNLKAQAVSATQVNLSWTAATDNQGVANYRIYRGSTHIGTAQTTTYGDVTVSPSTNYVYTVRAVDAAGNVSQPSNQVSVATPAPSDTTAPTVAITAPANSATVKGTVAVTAAASDNVGVTRVDFYLNGSLLFSDANAPYTYSWDSTDEDDGLHSISARAFDAAGNTRIATSVTVRVLNNSDTVPGDVNGDNVVGIADLSILATNFGQQNRTRLQGDLNGDGLVNVVDLSILASNWGK